MLAGCGRHDLRSPPRGQHRVALHRQQWLPWRQGARAVQAAVDVGFLAAHAELGLVAAHLCCGTVRHAQHRAASPGPGPCCRLAPRTHSLLNGRPLLRRSGDTLSHRRILDMRRGVLLTEWRQRDLLAWSSMRERSTLSHCPNVPSACNCFTSRWSRARWRLPWRRCSKGPDSGVQAGAAEAGSAVACAIRQESCNGRRPGIATRHRRDPGAGAQPAQVVLELVVRSRAGCIVSASGLGRAQQRPARGPRPRGALGARQSAASWLARHCLARTRLPGSIAGTAPTISRSMATTLPGRPCGFRCPT